MTKQIINKLFRLNAFALITAIIFNTISLPVTAPLAYGIDTPDTSYFLKNKGQTDEQVAYYGSVNNGTVYVEQNGDITYKLTNPKSDNYTFTETILSDNQLTPAGKDKKEIKISSFIGEGQTSSIPAYGIIDLGETTNNISTHLETKNGTVEKIFTVNPGGDPSSIHIKVDGIKDLSINQEGEIQLSTLDNSATYSFSEPIAYQLINNKKKYVSAEYFISEPNTYSFKVGDYNPALPLIIDPLLGSTYLGGSGTEYTSETYGGNRQMVFASSSVYVTGVTDSLDFPTSTGPHGTTGSTDIFVTRYDSTITTVLSSTLIGSTENDTHPTIAADSSGNIFIAALTASATTSDYPVTVGAYDETYNSIPGTTDVVISKLSADLSTLIASTFFGGSFDDDVYSIAVNSSGGVYIAGDVDLTKNHYFPITAGTLDTSIRLGGNDAYIAKFPNDLSATGYASTYFYNDPYNPVITIGPAPNEDILITGKTYDVTSLSTTGAFQETHGGGTNDNFVANVTSDLTTLNAFTYFGGTSYTDSVGIITTDGTDIIVASDVQSASSFSTAISANPNTTSFNNFCPSASIANCTARSLVVAKFPTTLASAEVAITGGNNNVIAGGVITDSSDNIFAVASTLATDFPTTNGAYSETDPDSANNYSDIVLTKFSSTLTTLSASTYFGASGNELYPYGITIDASENVYINGQTDSADLTVTSGAPQTTYGGSNDFFISKFSNGLSGGAPDAIIDLAATSNNQSIDLSWSEPANNGAPITAYIVEYKLTSDGTWSTCSDSSCTDATTGANVPGLTNWETYEFRVYAINDTGTSGASNTITSIPTPCGALKDNDDQTTPGSVISQSCIGATVTAGSIYFDNVPDSFSFPQKFYSQNAQASFSNDDPATRTATDIYSGPEDVLTVADLRNDNNGFYVNITSTAFSDGVNTIPLSGLYVATSCPEYVAASDPDNDLSDDLYSSPLSCDNTTGVEFADGSIISGSMNIASMVHSDSVIGTDKTAIIQAFMDDGLPLSSGPVTIINSIGAKVGMMSQIINFYLDIPAEQPPGSYSILFTLDLIDALAM